MSFYPAYLKYSAMAISANLYNKIIPITRSSSTLGGQELILFEIIASCHGFNDIYLPFYSSGTLFKYLLKNGFAPLSDHRTSPFDFSSIPKGEVLYFGTPTIVDDQPLFNDTENSKNWNKFNERKFVTWLCASAKRKGYKKIISGLGSGDISVQERIQDMGGGRIICYKKFDDFEDWIIELIIKEEVENE